MNVFCSIPQVGGPCADGSVYNFTAEHMKGAHDLDGGKGIYDFCRFTVFRTNSQDGAKRREIGRFSFAPLAGCCGIVVSTDSFLAESWRGGVVSETFHALKEETAKKLGYSLMLATTQLRNIPEVVGASKARWKFIHFFRNKRTNNDLGLMVKEI